MKEMLWNLPNTLHPIPTRMSKLQSLGNIYLGKAHPELAPLEWITASHYPTLSPYPPVTCSSPTRPSLLPNTCASPSSHTLPISKPHETKALPQILFISVLYGSALLSPLVSAQESVPQRHLAHWTSSQTLQAPSVTLSTQMITRY